MDCDLLLGKFPSVSSLLVLWVSLEHIELPWHYRSCVIWTIYKVKPLWFLFLICYSADNYFHFGFTVKYHHLTSIVLGPNNFIDDSEISSLTISTGIQSTATPDFSISPFSPHNLMIMVSC